MSTTKVAAPNGPGIRARWTSSAKTGVGTALSSKSNLWFTLSHGIFKEIYYPRIDQACVRDMGFIVTDGADFFSEEKRDAGSQLHWITDGVPGFRLVNTCRHGRYHIEKEVVTDPHRDAVLQHTRFVAPRAKLRSYKLSPQTVKRYLTNKTVSPRLVWRFNHKIRSIPAGKILRIETLKPVVIHWSPDDWHTAHDVAAHEVGLGIYIADLATEGVPEGKPVKFTFYWPDSDHWQGADFVVHVGSFKRANGNDARQD